MDPFSTAASAVAILGSLTVTSNAVLRLWKSPQDLEELQSMFEYVNAVVSSVSNLASDRKFEGVDPLVVHRPLAKFHEAHDKFKKQLLKLCHSQHEKSKSNRFHTLVHRREIDKSWKQLLAIESEIKTAIALMTLSNSLGRNGYSLETSATFFPERYGMNEPCLALFSAVELYHTTNISVHSITLSFASTCRHRRWVSVVLIMPLVDAGKLAMDGAHFLGQDWLMLPEPLERGIEKVLSNGYVKSKQVPKRLVLNLDYKEGNEISLTKSTAQSALDMQFQKVEEAGAREESALLTELLQRYPQHYLESEVIFLRQYTNYELIGLGSQVYLGKRAPPIGAGLSGRNLVAEFSEQLRSFLDVQDCPSVARFIGAVLTDDRKRLHSVMMELPQRGPLRQYIEFTKRKGSPVSWARRESWVRQLLKSVKEIHQRGSVIGDLAIGRIWLDSDENIVLPSMRQLDFDADWWPGAVPPEFRCEPTGHRLTLQSDLFRLGQVIWLLAENASSVVSRLCRRNNCPSPGWLLCLHGHADPIALPACQPDVPAYINRIVDSCRQRCPSQRLPADELYNLLPDQEIGAPDITLDVLAMEPFDENVIICEECGERAEKNYYHCPVCDLGNFDICFACYQNGVRCFDSSHQLQHRALRRGSLVDIS